MLEMGRESITKLAASQVVTSVLEEAIKNNATYIHIEPTKDAVIVRLRIDGLLRDGTGIPKKQFDHIIARLKTLGNMKLDERRIPQDGRFKQKIDGRDFSFITSTLPTIDGEKIAIHIIEDTPDPLNLENLGYWGQNLKVFNAVNNRGGLVLVTGPNDAGKSTSLYSKLSSLNDNKIHIATIEDPIEYRIKGATQVQVNPKLHLTFTSALQAIFKQDVNVILISEFNDSETASLAFSIAESGRLVFSTLHTIDSASTIKRLIDIGIQPAVVAHILKLITGQRLVRKLCLNCREEFEIDKASHSELVNLFRIDIPAQMKRLHQLEIDYVNFMSTARDTKTSKRKLPAAKDLSTTETRVKRLFRAKLGGCEKCHNTGYLGRIGIFEALNISETIQQLIVGQASSEVIHNQALKEGMIPLLIDGLVKTLQGITTIDELIRASSGISNG
jgi:type II secretory ATPase GspE/PulE/Tfp pilus assembly ATPase PilB-like protein